MTPALPPPLRAAAGLAARSLDEARRLPQLLVSLPIRVAGAAMQASLRLQQEYAGLVARGDELLLRFGGTEETPPWATFDEDPVDPPVDGPVTPIPAAATAIEEAADELDRLEPPPPIAPPPAIDLPPAIEVPPAIEDAAVDVDRLEPPPPIAAYEPVPTGPPPTGPIPGPKPVPGPKTRSPRTPRSDLGRVGRGQGRAAVAPFLTKNPDSSAGPTSAFDRALREDPLLTTGAATSPEDDPAKRENTAEPVPGYDGWSGPQLRARLRGLSARQLAELLAYEDVTRARGPYMTMLQNRLVALGPS